MTAPPSDDSTRARLISSARRLFTSGSYGSVGVQELCKDADVRRGSFYYQFESKQELALAALDAEWEVLHDDVFEPAFAQGNDAVLALDLFQDLLYECHKRRAAEVERFGGCLLVSLSQEMATIDERIRVRAAEHMARARTYFVTALDAAVADRVVDAIDVSASADRILTYFEGTMAQARAQGDPEAIARMKFDLLRLVR